MKTWIGNVHRKREGVVMVKVESYIKHPKYGKYMRRSTLYPVADPLGCAIGEKVKICETVKISKTISKKVIERLAS